MKLDLNYLGKDAKGRQVMDITTPEGMALLGLYGERFQFVFKKCNFIFLSCWQDIFGYIV